MLRVANGRLLEAAFGPAATEVFKQTENVHIVACGTSYHAAVTARTKAFTTQLTALGMLVVALAKHHGADAERERGLVARLVELPGLMERTLELDRGTSGGSWATRGIAPPISSETLVAARSPGSEPRYARGP